METCAICSAPLRGRQEKFCGRKCKNRYTNCHAEHHNPDAMLAPETA